MTLDELLARIGTGRLANDEPRRPMPEAPSRYPGRAGALQRDPVPGWVGPLQGRVQDRLAAERQSQPPRRPPTLPDFPIGPGGLVEGPGLPPPGPGEGPPALRAPLGALTGDRPALGDAGSWINPQGPLPRGPFVDRPQRDPEPWRAPMPAQGIAVGGAAPRRGREPDSAPGMAQQDDLDAAWNAALARVRSGRLNPGVMPMSKGRR